MKSIFFLLISLLLSTVCFSQTFKITDVVAPDKYYKEATSRYLGKNLTLNVYDNSASISIGKLSMVLKKRADNEYENIERDNEREKIIYVLKLNTTMSVITSLTWQFLAFEKDGQRRNVVVTCTGKRF
ncbi:hypothetical protein DYU05_20595 [Mucilaginibacter terrenus]|uniref:Uncharacterized protein n=1 Tax=Mucilaginibacter terrenus TaxID=2482727 RepID=A0A3E2NJJ2_9SPHI|nr:hypothetical protein [Mucilaginibacter terrenus]RFZ81159.1 hypothetical protein DYU05_20595 [Mucilaginibacter terrenus]